MCLKKFLSLSSFLLLVACGGDSGNSSAPSDFDEEIESSSSQKSVSSSSSVKGHTSSSSSEVKVVSSSSSVESSSSGEKESPSSSAVNEQSRSSSSKPVVIAIKDKSFSGTAEKGPFARNSKVTIYELDSDFAQTGNSYSTEIFFDNDSHSFLFTMPNVTLANQYVLLEVDGFFYNEMNGNLSSNKITLKVLSDLSNRDKVNINLLTHLEYKRVLYLVDAGMNFAEAKKQAEAEVLNAFGIKGEFANSEDLENFGRKDENAALLAMSVLVLSYGEDNLVDNLNRIAADIEKDGLWDDDDFKAKFADLAQEKDLTGALDDIHTTLREWNVGWVPDFEKYVQNFWYESYGLGECGSSNKGIILDVKNEHSAVYGSKKRFICKDSVWVIASNIEQDFYKFDKKGVDGEFWVGTETGTQYKYDEKMGEWQYASALDVAFNKACTSDRIDMTNEDNGKQYYCSINGWVCPADGWNWDVPNKYRANMTVPYGEMTDTRDGKKYRTVTIGEGDKKQTWMAENLNYYNADDETLNGHSWCYGTISGENTVACDVGGRLYKWAAAMAKKNEECGHGHTCGISDEMVQGVCPPGWHLPNLDEWMILVENVGGSKIAGKVLRSQTGWRNDGNGTDDFGFTVLPLGYKINKTEFRYDALAAIYWCATELQSVFFGSSSKEISVFDGGSKDNGYSVRCLQN